MAHRAGFNPNDSVAKKSDSTDSIVAGFLTGVITRSIIQPLDVLKVRYQLQAEAGHEAKYRSIRQTLATMLREEGVRAFWKGHMSAQYLSAVYMPVQFYGVDVFTRKVFTVAPSLNDTAHKRTLIVGCGGLFGGTLATLVSFPFDVVRTRTIAQPSTNAADPGAVYYRSTRGALGQILRGEGPAGLYRGVAPQLLSMGPTSAINFTAYAALAELAYFAGGGRQLSVGEKFACGALAGGAAKSVMYPMDTVRKRLQVQGFAAGRRGLGRTAEYDGLRHCVRLMYRHEGGISAFYKGFGPGMAKALLSTGLYFSLFEVFKPLLVGRKL